MDRIKAIIVKKFSLLKSIHYVSAQEYKSVLALTVLASVQ